jgi:hypothetical protein
MDTNLSINNTDKNMSIIEGEVSKKAGRRPIPNEYIEKDGYIEGILISKGTRISFNIDKDDLDKVKTRHWYAATGGKYIGSFININGKYITMYLHNFVMNKLTFEGRGQKESVDHINRNGLDNRKCNLRVISQTLQNINQNKKARKVILPPEYNLSSNDLPKHICYVPSRGNHGDGFCVEFKKYGKKIYNPYIRSKVLSIEEKLEKIKVLLQKGYQMYPEFSPTHEHNKSNI